MNDDQSKEENRNRMRALALDGMQSLREGDLAGGAECLDLLVKRATSEQELSCPKCRCRRRWIVAHSVKGAAILRGLQTSIGKARGLMVRLRMYWYGAKGLWNLLTLHFRMRVLLRFVPCRCPKEEATE